MHFFVCTKNVIFHATIVCGKEGMTRGRRHFKGACCADSYILCNFTFYQAGDDAGR